MKKFAIISLGCARNLVDSEVMAGTLIARGFSAGTLEDGVDICVVNTCAFIEPAREESVDSLLEIASLKKKGIVKRLVVCGCLPQLYKGGLFKSLPEADLIIGTGELDKLSDLLNGLELGKRLSSFSNSPSYLYDDRSPRFKLTPKHYSYIKISEGCSNLCSYCIISHLRGRFRSRTIESVLKEIERSSRDRTLREIELIGQDTTLFGMDRYSRMALPELLEKIAGIDTGVEWIRILYTHPAHYTKELITAIRDTDKVCKYLDLPIQHINGTILRKMNRHTTKLAILKLIEDLRRSIPGLVIRTSIIVGFPGETDRIFNELIGALKDIRFERLGAFKYSREESTPAGRMAKQVPESVKEERLEAVMRLQRDISSDINAGRLGSKVRVLIDSKEDGVEGVFIGRTSQDAPEVDGVVYVSGPGIKIGEFCDVRITDTLEYDLVGETV